MGNSSTEVICAVPNFFVQSIPDGEQFEVQKARLQDGSEIFRDMFLFCDPSPAVAGDQVLKLQENASTLATLLRLLHNPPAPIAAPCSEEDEDDIDITARVDIDNVIPLPVLRTLLDLADKYALSDSIVHSLHSHLAAQVSLFPLEIYAYAVQHGLRKIATDASAYLLYPSLSTYTSREISIIPSSEAYHELVLLHYERVKQLKDLLRGEEIFPHGYGKCLRHGDDTRLAWGTYKHNLILKLEAGTDVTAEMRGISSTLHQCEVCHRACEAALDMLDYKFRKVIKRIDQLPMAQK
ncbi:hypothetical protein NEOLEDRAFT_1142150 [Neolentinus lepideus HHB14362 ss-1]|uniref:BTB domain-containing protein n=1 Tax=Neolentinus lepideus HHB14362 ss-1 TaxID=1314782 RepID=A0A165NA66_9AGAM|nr:hypothetical protein NEOLEDRAFT_1142150 [Neolentinus lepideus HHB14362 ss-1]